jgi:hypothetical protein
VILIIPSIHNIKEVGCPQANTLSSLTSAHIYGKRSKEAFHKPGRLHTSIAFQPEMASKVL